MSTVTDIVVSLWGLLGGIIRALDTAIRTDAVLPAHLLVANVLIAGFCGLLASSVAAHFDPDWTTVGAGVGGYLGTTTIDVLVSLVSKVRHHE